VAARRRGRIALLHAVDTAPGDYASLLGGRPVGCQNFACSQQLHQRSTHEAHRLRRTLLDRLCSTAAHG
jgi:hypothetical protein